VDLAPVADGGDGTVDALVLATGGRKIPVPAVDPLGRPIEAEIGVLGDGQTAVVEMAQASGLARLKPEERNPLVTTTYGTGLLIRAALDAGFRRIIVGIGGSATNDGGAGMLQALGMRLLDRSGRPIPPGGQGLLVLERVDASGLDPRLAEAEIIVASDVTNPLCGPQGAAAVYGPQKGATPEMVRLLDEALARFAEVVRRDLGRDVAGVPGAGAAGGLGAGLLLLPNVRIRPGADVVFEAVGLDARLAACDLVVTGEGAVDRSTAFGKTPARLAERARARGRPVVLLAGRLGPGYEEVYGLGVGAVVPIVPGPLSEAEAMASAADLLSAAAERTCRLIDLGRLLAGNQPA
jgi:glycerate kinase